MSDLVVLRPEGLYCPAGDFHIDPWRPVPRAVITHGHSDHARVGMGELWHKALQSVWLDDPATLALHHGSIDLKLRQAAEQGHCRSTCSRSIASPLRWAVDSRRTRCLPRR